MLDSKVFRVSRAAMVATIVAIMISLIAGASTQRCNETLPSLTTCQPINHQLKRYLAQKVDNLLKDIEVNTNQITTVAERHEQYRALNEVERGLNINPKVQRDDLTVVGRSLDVLDKCFLPLVKEMSNSEEKRYKLYELFQFYPELNVAKNGIVEILHSLRKLVKSDSRLSSGSGCSIAMATCTPPTYITTKQNGAPLTPMQKRLQPLVVIASSLEDYSRELRLALLKYP